MADPEILTPQMMDKPQPPRIGGNLGRVSIQQLAKEIRLKRLKELIFIVLFGGLAFSSGWELPRALASDGLFDWVIFWPLVFGYLAVFGLTSMVFSWRASGVLSLLGIFLFLYTKWWGTLPLVNFTTIVLMGGAIHFIGSQTMRSRMENGLKFNFGASLKSGLGYVFTGFAVVFTLIYYFTFIFGGPRERLFIDESTIDNLLGGSQYLIQAYAPVRRGMTVDEMLGIITKATKKEAMELLLQKEPKLRDLPEAEFNRLITELEKQRLTLIRQNTSLVVGQKLTGKEKTSTVLIRYLKEKYELLPVRMREAFFFIWLGLFFIFMWTFAHSLTWFVNAVGWVLLQIFLSLRLLETRSEPAERQTLVIP